MRICRFDGNRFGLVQGDEVRDVTAAFASLPQHAYPFPRTDLMIENLATLRPAIEAAARDVKPVALASLTLQSPIANPGKIVAAPVNYKKHLDEARGDAEIHHQNAVGEIQRVGLFLKATSSVVGCGEGVAMRHADRRNDHEIELAVVIGKAADRVGYDEALDYVAGYCIGLDMTIRGPEERSLRKSLDTFTVLGPYFVTADEIQDPAGLDLELTVDGEKRQVANTRDLILDVKTLISWASSFYTLHPGDVILTGTPEGVGPVLPGNTIRATISRIGTMDVKVRELPPR
ncbi:MAG: 5-carboxymethyl-2-hydroxymuconate delta-isomerase [Hyphomicrobiales bacterium]|nr:5-carboxymethyl-2-hydroxymuconate delta-isomerase [Hyphomicrobiales bacterium]